MKSTSTLLLLAACFLFSIASNAQQIPNGGFESWTNATYAEVPVGGPGTPWVSNDSLIYILNGVGPNKAIKKVTDAHSGAYALCVQESYIYIPSTGYKDSGGGVIFLGYVNFSNFQPYGVPFTGRPTSISGFYKMTARISGADTGSITADFKNGGNLIGSALGIFSGNVSNYQAFTIPIDWTNTQSPDKLEFAIANGGVDMISNDTSTRFFVDDLVFDYPNGVKENLFANEGVLIFPNPASDKVNIRLSPGLSVAGNYLTLHDVTGKQLLKMKAANEQSIPTESLPNGTYFLQLKDANNSVIYGARVSVMH